MEQKLKEFINKWLNKFCEVSDPTNKNQCFDLVVAWTDFLGFPRLFPHLYAYQIYTVDTDEKKKYFDKIPNTSDAYPQAGDIIVWAKAYNGTAGHTAIATGNHQTQGKSTDWFEAFSQNDPTGSPCIIKKYSYNNVLGWLRPKKELVKFDDYYLGIDLNNKESIKVCVSTWKEVVDGKFIRKEEVEKNYVLKSEYDNLVNQLTQKDDTIKNLNQQIKDLNAKNTLINDENRTLRGQVEEYQNRLKTLEDEISKVKEQLTTLNQLEIDFEKYKKDWEIKEINYQKQIKTLQTRLEGYKSPIKKLLTDIWLKVVKGEV